jgi:hypothetical protein
VVPQGRRRERRSPYRVLCRLIVAREADCEWATLIGQTVNVSTSGMAVRVTHELPVGARIRIVIPRQHGEPAIYEGSVAHCDRVLSQTYEIGVEFET